MIFEIRVYPFRIGGQDRFRFVRKGLILLFGSFAPAKRGEELVRIYGALAEHLRRSAFSHVTVEVHLPEAVLGMDIALCKEQVMGSRCINMWNSHLVAINIHGCIKSLELDFSVNFGKGFRRNGIG